MVVSLEDLHRAIVSVVDAGGGHKVFFYASDGDGYGIRHGFIGVMPDGRGCEISFERMDNERALREIPRLSFLRVHTLAMATSSSVAGINPTLEIAHVLNLLDPALRLAAPTHAMPARLAVPMSTAHPAGGTAASDADKESATIRLAHIQLQRKATDLLKNLYGSSAITKVSAIASIHCPITQSGEFIEQCEQLAGIVVGANKAQELFMPLRKLISA